MFKQAHERSLDTDTLMGLLRQLQDRRPNLKIVIMSATLQIDLFTSFFNDCIVVSVPGRQFPVEILYAGEPEPDFVEAAMLTCLQIHEDEEPGGVLVFLPGQEDIESLQNLLSEYLPSVQGKTHKKMKHSHNNGLLQDFCLQPLYAAMSSDDQLKAFDVPPPGVRKFVLSTNIAETSVTVSDIKYVVDLGFVKSRWIHAQTGLEMLKTVAVSKAQANQRAGRAGRTCAGKCFRLYTESFYESSLEEVSLPEIQRVNIGQMVLQLKEIGIGSIHSFPLPSPPSSSGLRKAFELLLALGALDKVHVVIPFFIVQPVLQQVRCLIMIETRVNGAWSKIGKTAP